MSCCEPSNFVILNKITFMGSSKYLLFIYLNCNANRIFFYNEVNAWILNKDIVSNFGSDDNPLD